MTRPNLIIVAQKGRLTCEAVLFVASLRLFDPSNPSRVFVAEPSPGERWPDDPRIADADARDLLRDMGATVLPFDTPAFGARYPNANKAQALMALPPGPFVFLDTDTIVTGALSRVPFDPARPSASMRREDTWPRATPSGPDAARIWRSLYDMFGLDYGASLDRRRPVGDWRRHLYFNAGWFHGPDAPDFGRRLLDTMRAIEAHPPPELAGQALFPWLDQIALPLVIHGLGGGRPGRALDGLDGDVTCHWRVLPLLYARGSDAQVDALEQVAATAPVRAVLARYPAFRRMILEGEGRRVRALFDRDALPDTEADIRRTLRAHGHWIR